MEKIGWIGLGVMGKSMCSHILKKGYEVSIYTRTKEKALELIELGAKWKSSPKEVAENSDIIFLIVGYPKDVEEVILSNEGILSGCKENSIIVDMTTSKPSLAEEIYKKAKEKNVHSLDAPVSGGDIGAKNATLSIMVGGDKEVFEKVLPLFETMGKTIELMGSQGKGQHTKMANQISVAAAMIGTVETLKYAHNAGLDLNHVIKVVGSGAGGTWSLSNLGPRIISDDFDPGFMIKHFVKDMGIALEETERMGIMLHGLKMVNEFYKKAMELGYENLGTQALYKIFDELEK